MRSANGTANSGRLMRWLIGLLVLEMLLLMMVMLVLEMLVMLVMVTLMVIECNGSQPGERVEQGPIWMLCSGRWRYGSWMRKR